MKWYVSSSSSCGASSFSFALLFTVLVPVVLARFAGEGFVAVSVEGFLGFFAFLSLSLRFWAAEVVMVMLLRDARMSEGLEVFKSRRSIEGRIYAPGEKVMCRADERGIGDSQTSRLRTNENGIQKSELNNKFNANTHHWRHFRRLLPELSQLVPNVDVRTVQQDVEDGVRSTRIVA